MALFEGRRGLPGHLRHRATVDPRLTDRQLFDRAPLGDPWIDAGMHHVWKYLYNCKHVEIPDSWEQTLRDFDSELTRVVPRLHFNCFRFFYNIDSAYSESTPHPIKTFMINEQLINILFWVTAKPRYVFLKLIDKLSTISCNNSW